MPDEDDSKRRSSGTFTFIVGLSLIFLCLLMMLCNGPAALFDVTPKGYRSSGLPMFLFFVLGIVMVVISVKDEIVKK